MWKLWSAVSKKVSSEQIKTNHKIKDLTIEKNVNFPSRSQYLQLIVSQWDIEYFNANKKYFVSNTNIKRQIIPVPKYWTGLVYKHIDLSSGWNEYYFAAICTRHNSALAAIAISIS